MCVCVRLRVHVCMYTHAHTHTHTHPHIHTLTQQMLFFLSLSSARLREEDTDVVIGLSDIPLGQQSLDSEEIFDDILCGRWRLDPPGLLALGPDAVRAPTARGAHWQHSPEPTKLPAHLGAGRVLLLLLSSRARCLGALLLQRVDTLRSQSSQHATSFAFQHNLAKTGLQPIAVEKYYAEPT